LRDFLGNGFSGGDFLFPRGDRSFGPAGSWKVSSSNLSERGFLVPVKVRPGGESAPALRLFPANGFSGDNFLLPRGDRSLGAAGLRKVSSSNLSGRGFLVPVKPRPESEAAGLRVFLSKGFSCGDFLLPPGARPVDTAEVREVSSSNLSDRGFLAPLAPRPEGGAAPGLRLFLPEDPSGEDLLLPKEGRPVFEAAVGPPCCARVGFFLLTDKGSPREEKGKNKKVTIQPKKKTEYNPKVVTVQQRRFAAVVDARVNWR
jgi:hypothetical protein